MYDMSHSRAAIALIVGLATSWLHGAPATDGPAKTQFRWAAWEIPAGEVTDGSALSIETDEDAESVRVIKDPDGEEKKETCSLLRRVNRRQIAKSQLVVAQTPAVAFTAIKPGVYRVRARVKVDGDTNVIGTPVRLSIMPVHMLPNGKWRRCTPPKNVRNVGNGLDQGQSFYSHEFKESGRYQEISFVYEMDPTFEKRRVAPVPIHPSALLRHNNAQALAAKAPKPKVIPPTGFVVKLFLPKTKYSVTTGHPPNSLRTVNVDWIDIEQISPSPSITVRHVLADKRWLKPGTETGFEIGLENFSDTPHKRKLVVGIERGLKVWQELHSEDVELAAGEAKTIRVPWKTQEDSAWWGYEVRAEIRAADGAVDSMARDFFSLHPRNYATQVENAHGFRHWSPFIELPTGQNDIEVYAASEGDCAKVTPDNDQWIGGMDSPHPFTLEAVRGAIKHNTALGVKTFMYLFGAGGTDVPIMDLYQQRPEWFADRIAASDKSYYMMKAAQDDMAKFDFNNKKWETPKIPHVETALNYWFPELMERVTKDTENFVKKTGYQGIRFDVTIFMPRRSTTIFGEKLPFPDDEAARMKRAAENFQGFAKAMKRIDPDFEFGANMDSWEYLQYVGLRDQPPPDPTKYTEFVAFANAHGFFMEEGTMNYASWYHPMNIVADANWALAQKRAMVRRFGGYHQAHSPSRDRTPHFVHDNIYHNILVISNGNYYAGSFSATVHGTDSSGQFITRFAEFFRDEELKPLADAEDVIFLNAPYELWYADSSVWRDIDGKRRYVVPLINPPVEERFRRNKTNELPEAIDEAFTAEVQIPEGYTRATASELTWVPNVASNPLPVTVTDGVASIEVPGIKLFKTLVVEFEK